MRKDQKFKAEYQKDADFEKVLSLMNEKLFQVEDELIDLRDEHFPTVHVIGAPRSGTTLALQLLAEHLEIGYINNLIAAFWKAPLFGIALSEHLLHSRYKSNYSSTYGRTNQIEEPHEFGYFWNFHLKYETFKQKGAEHEKNIDWSYLAILLKNMCKAFDKPVLFKSFLYGFHAQRAVQELNKTCFIYIRRNLIDNAMSILKMRRDYMGDIDKWASIQPKQYNYLKNQDSYVQVVGQVLFLEYEYIKQLEQIPAVNFLIVEYENLCEQTQYVLNKVTKLIGHHYQTSCFSFTTNSKTLRTNKYDRNSNAVKKLEKARSYLLDEFPELNKLIENRKKNVN